MNGNLINESFTNWQDGQQPKYETNPLVDQEDCLELGRWNGELWNDNKCTWSQNYPLCHIPFQGSIPKTKILQCFKILLYLLFSLLVRSKQVLLLRHQAQVTTVALRGHRVS